MQGLKFIAACTALLSAMAGAWGQPVALPRIGWVLSGTPENSGHLVEAIRAGLADEGFVDGKNLILDVRFLAGRSERYSEVFADLVRQPVTVRAAASHAGISAARDVSRGRIPVSGYFCGNDVKQMVQSFAQPGGNITGVSCLSAELAVKRIELLKDAVPGLRRIGFMCDPRVPGKDKELAETGEIASKLGMSVTSATVSAPEGFREAIASLRRDGADALVTPEDSFTFANRAQIVALAAEFRLVDISAFREFVMAGGVMSYGASVAERIRLQARYAARMVRGTKPSDLPIDQARHFEFVVNLKAARALNLSIPQRVLLRADALIQ